MNRQLVDRLLLWFAVAQLAVSVIAWPLSAATWARDEPPFVLGLSWFTVFQGALVFVLTALIRRDGNGDDGST